jgi:glycosyltransferase involved in cell wall biosynthesis
MVDSPLTDRSLTIIIPVLNECDGLTVLIKRLPPVLDQLTPNWQVLFVDDGSTDDTLMRIRAHAAIDKRITAIALSRNFGKEIAIAAGLRYATGDAAIIMDADLQHPPEVLSAFVERWLEGYEVVYGQRVDRNIESPARRFLARLFYRTYNAIVETDIPEGAGDFRLLDRKAVDAMNAIGETSRFNKGLYSWIGFKSIGVPFTVAERLYGQSKWRFGKLMSFAIDGLTSFTTLPLRVWSLLGVIISLCAMTYAVYIVIETLLYGGDVPGYASLIVSIMFFSGVQLISLGVLGQYIGRVYEEVKERPLFIITEAIGMDEKQAGRIANDRMPRPAAHNEPSGIN